mgnify:CR=1 FL=1|tara:strand:- start:417 stop:698 length:282 start_codon:yes stop_codon:yes gene_type:complete
MTGKIDWPHLRATRFSDDTPPSDWANGVRPISQNGLGLLGIDDNGALYWDGKKIEIKNTLTLSKIQLGLAIMVAIAASVSAAMEIIKYVWPAS